MHTCKSYNTYNMLCHIFKLISSPGGCQIQILYCNETNHNIHPYYDAIIANGPVGLLSFSYGQLLVNLILLLQCNDTTYCNLITEADCWQAFFFLIANHDRCTVHCERLTQVICRHQFHRINIISISFR